MSRLLEVRWFLKNRQCPIGILGSESHLTVLFSNEKSLVQLDQLLPSDQALISSYFPRRSISKRKIFLSSLSFSPIRHGEEWVHSCFFLGRCDQWARLDEIHREKSFDQRIETSIGSRSTADHHSIAFSPRTFSSSIGERLCQWPAEWQTIPHRSFQCSPSPSIEQRQSSERHLRWFVRQGKSVKRSIQPDWRCVIFFPSNSNSFVRSFVRSLRKWFADQQRSQNEMLVDRIEMGRSLPKWLSLLRLVSLDRISADEICSEESKRSPPLSAMKSRVAFHTISQRKRKTSSRFVQPAEQQFRRDFEHSFSRHVWRAIPPRRTNWTKRRALEKHRLTCENIHTIGGGSGGGWGDFSTPNFEKNCRKHLFLPAESQNKTIWAPPKVKKISWAPYLKIHPAAPDPHRHPPWRQVEIDSCVRSPSVHRQRRRTTSLARRTVTSASGGQ